VRETSVIGLCDEKKRRTLVANNHRQTLFSQCRVADGDLDTVEPSRGQSRRPLTSCFPVTNYNHMVYALQLLWHVDWSSYRQATP
jgi:hypothetical protein